MPEQIQVMSAMEGVIFGLNSVAEVKKNLALVSNKEQRRWIESTAWYINSAISKIILSHSNTCAKYTDMYYNLTFHQAVRCRAVQRSQKWKADLKIKAPVSNFRHNVNMKNGTGKIKYFKSQSSNDLFSMYCRNYVFVLAPRVEIVIGKTLNLFVSFYWNRLCC